VNYVNLRNNGSFHNKNAITLGHIITTRNMVWWFCNWIIFCSLFYFVFTP